MTNVVIVDAVRTPIGKRNGGLSTMHPGETLGLVQRAIIDRTGIDPDRGRSGRRRMRQPGRRAGLQHHPYRMARCGTAAERRRDHDRHAVRVQPAGHQSRRHPWSVPVSSTSAIACGVEAMSRVPIGASGSKKLGLGVPIPTPYFDQYEMTSQFEGAERIADKWGITREDTDAFGLASQQRAIQAWEEDRFAGQYITVEAPDVDENGTPTGSTHIVTPRRRATRNVAREAGHAEARRSPANGVHTAGNASQISDGAAAVMLMTEEKAAALGLTPEGPDRRHVPRRYRSGS